MRTRCKTCAFSLVFLLPLLALPSVTGDAAKGKELFSSRCAACHGSSGEGKEAIAKLFNVKLPSLGSKEVQSMEDAVLKKYVLEGKGKMKPVSITDQEAADVIAFVRTLKK